MTLAKVLPAREEGPDSGRNAEDSQRKRFSNLSLTATCLRDPQQP
jgi:hypothetical protein